MTIVPESSRPSAADNQTAPTRDITFSRLLTADELAARWQVPKAHVYRLSREHRIPTVRLGRWRRYRLDDIDAWERGEFDSRPEGA